MRSILELALVLVNGKPWDGKIHFSGEPDRFARTRALFKNEAPMDQVARFADSVDYRWLIAGVSVLFVAAWVWFLSGKN